MCLNGDMRKKVFKLIGLSFSSFSEKSLLGENGLYKGFLPSVEMTNTQI